MLANAWRIYNSTWCDLIHSSCHLAANNHKEDGSFDLGLLQWCHLNSCHTLLSICPPSLGPSIALSLPHPTVCLYSGHFCLHNSSFIKQHHTSGKGWGKGCRQLLRHIERVSHREDFCCSVNGCVRSHQAMVQCTYCKCQMRNLTSPVRRKFCKCFFFCRFCSSSRRLSAATFIN